MSMTDGGNGESGPTRPVPPIAVVGLACRLPGSPDPEAFWRLLSQGRGAVTAAPQERWPDRAAGGVPRYGGFLDDVAGFDPDFFGISAAEAAAMDPQQRLMLELGWEALADAGTPAPDQHGSDTGVFIGAINDDYALLVRQAGPAAISAYSMTGLGRAIIANRLSHVFALRGPSLTVDTGQSSSLVAVHLAMESLRRGECRLALAGGVNLTLLPDGGASAARSGALSPDGHCYTFDARANGYVRGEGGALVALRPLADALAAGDHIYCVLVSSAVNNDGTPGTIGRPSATAQQEVLRLAYERAGIATPDVQYIELHGTGTPAGDPVEAAALGAALGTGRPADSPLLVGSAKTNVGHLEGAAGIVGLVKLALSITHRRIPASLHFRTANPAIPLAELNLAVAGATTTWPRPGQPLVAGVSAFGMGGTNCHVVVRESPVTTGPRPVTPAPAYQRRRFWFDAGPVAVPDQPTATTTAPPDADRMLATVCAICQAVLGPAAPTAITPDRTFASLGLGSLDLVELADRLGTATGREVADTVVFDHPTPAALARYLCRDGDPATDVLADLDRLARGLARLDPSDRETRTRIAAHLGDLRRTLSGSAGPTRDAVAGVMSASPAELFELIDHQSGWPQERRDAG